MGEIIGVQLNPPRAQTNIQELTKILKFTQYLWMSVCNP
jgi:hypothetical protein